MCVVVVKSKFAYAYTQEFPYRIAHVLECEFFLLESMVLLLRECRIHSQR